jgi:hypothetical protein
VDDKRKSPTAQALMRSMERELDFYRKRSADSVSVDRRLIDRTMAQARVSDLGMDDLARVIHDQLQTQRRELLEHMARLVKLIEYKIEAKNPRDEVRFKNFHERLCSIEADLRRLANQRK